MKKENNYVNKEEGTFKDYIGKVKKAATVGLVLGSLAIAGIGINNYLAKKNSGAGTFEPVNVGGYNVNDREYLNGEDIAKVVTPENKGLYTLLVNLGIEDKGKVMFWDTNREFEGNKIYNFSIHDKTGKTIKYGSMQEDDYQTLKKWRDAYKMNKTEKLVNNTTKNIEKVINTTKYLINR